MPYISIPKGLSVKENLVLYKSDK